MVSKSALRIVIAKVSSSPTFLEWMSFPKSSYVLFQSSTRLALRDQDQIPCTAPGIQGEPIGTQSRNTSMICKVPFSLEELTQPCSYHDESLPRGLKKRRVAGNVIHARHTHHRHGHAEPAEKRVSRLVRTGRLLHSILPLA